MMTQSKQNIVTLVSQKDDPKLFKRMADDFKFERKHPFLPEWKQWTEVVYCYHSGVVEELCRAINHGKFLMSPLRFVADFDWLLNEIQWQVDWLEDFAVVRDPTGYIDEVATRVELQKYFRQNTGIQGTACINYEDKKCECASTSVCEFDSTCVYRELHLKAKVSAFIWTWARLKRWKKFQRKYFQRLQRVVLSLPFEKLKFFSLDLLFNPRPYCYGRNLLKELYSRAEFDDMSTQSIVSACEYLKHFVYPKVRQQSGHVVTSQCRSGDLYPDELYELAEKCSERYTFEEGCRFFKVRQQGMFTVHHEVDVMDSNFEKMRNIILASQDRFLDGLKQTVLETSKIAVYMFAMATTVALVSRLAVGAVATVIVKLLHWIYSIICGGVNNSIQYSYRVVQQSGSEISVPFLPALVLNNLIAPPSDILKRIWEDKNTDLVMRRIGYFGDPRIERGIEKLTEWAHKCALEVVNWFRVRWLGVSPLEDLSSESSPVLSWAADVDEVVKKYMSQEFSWTEGNWSIIMNLYSRGLSLARQNLFVKYRSMIWKTVQVLGNILEKFKVHQRSGTSIRNPPVTIYLTGETGVGKSSVTYPLAAEILQSISEKEQFAVDLKKSWKNLIYMRSAEQEFWDGYDNQLVTVFDDFNQQADSASNPCIELFEIIRASNSFPYPLHMAEISQKANTHFTSKIIIVSSNNSKPKTQSLNYPEALYRRFDICVRVERKVITLNTNKFEPEAYILSLYNMSDNTFIRNITYGELVAMCADSYFSRKNYVDSIDAYIEEKLGVVHAQGQGVPRLPCGKFGEPVRWPLVDRFFFSVEKLFWGTVTSVVHPWMAWDAVMNQWGEWRNSACRWDDDREKRYLFYKLNQCSDGWVALKARLAQEWDDFRKKHSYLVKAALMVGVVSACLVFLRAFTDMTGGETKKVVLPVGVKAEAYSPVKVKTVKAEVYSPVKVRTVKAEYSPVKVKTVKAETAVRQQAVGDVQATEIASSVVRRNLYKIYESTVGRSVGHGIFLKGKIFLFPKHYHDAFRNSLKNDPDAELCFESVFLVRNFQIKLRDFLSRVKSFMSPDEEAGPVWSRDLCYVEVPTAVVHPDVTPYFATKSSLYRVDSTEVFLPVLDTRTGGGEYGCVVLRYAEGRSQLSRQETVVVSGDDDQPVRFIRDAWVYGLDTKPSECGAPLIVRNTQIVPGKICGIHIAGMDGTSRGYATPFYREDCEKILSLVDGVMSQDTSVTEMLGPFPKQQCQVPDCCSFLRLGSTDKFVAQPSKTKVVPSLCYALVKQPETRPCLLAPKVVGGEYFDPRRYRISRLGNVPPALDEVLLQNAKAAVLDEISSVLHRNMDLVTANIKPKYSFEEAVLGIPGEPYVVAVKRDTSPGYPFIQMKGFETRKKFFGDAVDYTLDTTQCDMLRLRCKSIIDHALQGIVLEHVFVDTLKDERKPIAKAHKTRLFSAGPLDYLIVCKQYFNPVVALLQQARNECHISVGSNPYSMDWDRIARILHLRSKNIVAGDFEGFDASQHQRMLEMCGEILVQLSVRFCGSTEEDARVMRVLLVSLFNSIHITGREVYQWTHSLPSGHYLTAIINSIFVLLSFVSVWQLEFGVSSYVARLFFEECGVVAYGDDHLVSIPDSRLKTFNQFTLPVLFSKIGLSYTMEDKDAEVQAPCRKLSDVSFLKRGFRWDESVGRWFGPLSLSTVLETPMWIHKCPDPRLQTIENLEWALKELSLHNDFTWECWASVLWEQQRRLGYYTKLRDQDETRLVCLSQRFEV